MIGTGKGSEAEEGENDEELHARSTADNLKQI